jgi:hypothetical protein
MFAAAGLADLPEEIATRAPPDARLAKHGRIAATIGAHYRDDLCCVAVIRPDGTGFHVLRHDLRGGELEFAPTGRRLLFRGFDNSAELIAILNPRTRKIIRISRMDVGSQAYGFTWASSARRIAYLEPQPVPPGQSGGAPVDLFSVRPDGTGKRKQADAVSQLCDK